MRADRGTTQRPAEVHAAFPRQFYRVILYTSPGVRYSVPGKQLDVKPNSVYFGFPGKLESWERKGNVTGYALFFTADFAGLDPLRADFEEQYPYFCDNGESLITCTEEESTRLRRISERMIDELHSGRNDRFDLIRHQLHVYLIRLRRIYYRQTEVKAVHDKKGNALFSRFRQAVENHFTKLSSGKTSEAPTVSLIANVLNVNAGYLSSIVKIKTGKTASAFIHEKTLLEAKSYLLHTELQVKEIAYRLGYGNVSYFNRFFKKNAGNTPLEYRNSRLS